MIPISRRQMLVGTGAMAAMPRVLATEPASLRVVRPRTERIDRPMGLEVAQPRFSWALESPRRNVVQKAYRVTVASDPVRLHASRADLWDSGRVESDSSLEVRYAGAALASGQRAWWRVEVWDSHADTAVLKEPAWFEMGLLEPDAWHAAQWLAVEGEEEAADRAAGLFWIWGEQPLERKAQRFRFHCTLPAAPSRAELLLAAKDHLQGVWVNGAALPLPRQIFWGTMLRLPLQLLPGANVICVAATADTSGFFPPDGGAVVALLKVTGPDGRITRFTTGTDWLTSTTGAHDWTRPGFDDRGWSHAVPSRARTQCEPWPAQPAMLLRHELEIGKPLARARLYATALGAYEARINGRKVGDAHLAPEITVASDHVLYQCHDVTSLLRRGKNALGAVVGDGWYASAFAWQNERYALGDGPRRFLAQLILDYEDGTREVVATGPKWRMTESAVRSGEIYNGEDYDARAEIAGWDQPGFDDQGWMVCAQGKRPAARLIAQIDPPIRSTLTLTPRRVQQLRPGVLVYDFGQNFAGWCRLRVQGTAGTTVQLRHAEVLLPSGEVDMSNLRGARATDRYTLKGAPAGETYEPRFTYHGFRYVEVSGAGNFTPQEILGIVAHTDAAETGELRVDNPQVQAIWHNALWSQRSNFFGVPTDCPQRDERMGWMGDIQVFLDAAAFNMDVDAFICRFMAEARAGQTPDGAFPVVTPQPRSFPEMVTSGWSDAGVILPWTLYQRYGETRVIEDSWEAMERWLSYIGSANPDFIYRKRRGLDLGDWLSVDAKQPADETTPRVLVATAYWACCARLMREMALAIGRSTDAARYAALHEHIAAAFARMFVKPDGTVGNGSQTSYVLALRFELVPEDLRTRAAALLAHDIRRRGMRLSTGFLGTPYLLDVLADHGQPDVALSLLLQRAYPSWGYMIAKGATTMWERWNGDVGDVAMNSYNHYAFGAVVGFMYRRLAGIAPAEPGFRRLDVRPLYDPRIGTVRARYDSCLGRIASQVSGDAQGLTRLALEIPAGSAARIELPHAAQAWREARRPLAGRSDLRIVSAAAAGTVLAVGSGSYDFTRGS